MSARDWLDKLSKDLEEYGKHLEEVEWILQGPCCDKGILADRIKDNQRSHLMKG